MLSLSFCKSSPSILKNLKGNLHIKCGGICICFSFFFLNPHFCPGPVAMAQHDDSQTSSLQNTVLMGFHDCAFRRCPIDEGVQALVGSLSPYMDVTGEVRDGATGGEPHSKSSFPFMNSLQEAEAGKRRLNTAACNRNAEVGGLTKKKKKRKKRRLCKPRKLFVEMEAVKGLWVRCRVEQAAGESYANFDSQGSALFTSGSRVQGERGRSDYLPARAYQRCAFPVSDGCDRVVASCFPFARYYWNLFQ